MLPVGLCGPKRPPRRTGNESSVLSKPRFPPPHRRAKAVIQKQAFLTVFMAPFFCACIADAQGYITREIHLGNAQ